MLMNAGLALLTGIILGLDPDLGRAVTYPLMLVAIAVFSLLPASALTAGETAAPMLNGAALGIVAVLVFLVGVGSDLSASPWLVVTLIVGSLTLSVLGGAVVKLAR